MTQANDNGVQPLSDELRTLTDDEIERFVELLDDDDDYESGRWIVR